MEKEKEKLIISHVVGYMMKLMKNNKDTSLYQKEFSAIRHGNYDEFINLVKGGITPMAIYNDGEICDLIMLMQSKNSLIKLYQKVYLIHGDIIDPDISDEIYCKLVEFEIYLRMHANNNNLIGDKEELVNVIDKLSSFKNLSDDEKEKLHNGRLFINYVKHNNKHKKNKKFSSYQEGINYFNDAYNVLINNKLTI